MKERRTTAPAPASGPISLSAILGLNHLVLSKPPNAQDSKASRPAAKDNVEHTHSNILRDAASIIGCFLMLRPPSADMPEYGLERKFWKHPFVVMGCLIGECSRVLELQICMVNSFQWIQDRRQVRNFVEQKNQMARRYIPISPNPPSDLSNPKQVQVIQGDQLRHSSWVNIEKVYMIGKDAIDVSRFSELTRLTLNSLNDIRQALSMPRLTKFYEEPSSPESKSATNENRKVSMIENSGTTQVTKDPDTTFTRNAVRAIQVSHDTTAHRSTRPTPPPPHDHTRSSLRVNTSAHISGTHPTTTVAEGLLQSAPSSCQPTNETYSEASSHDLDLTRRKQYNSITTPEGAVKDILNGSSSVCLSRQANNDWPPFFTELLTQLVCQGVLSIQPQTHAVAPENLSDNLGPNDTI